MHTIPATGGKVNFWGGPWRWLDLHPIASLVVLYLLCVAIFFASIPLPRVDGQLTGSDGAFYYAYLPTLLLDHDLDFTNQYAALVPTNVIARQPLTADGKPTNIYAVGTALLWAPFFLSGHCIALVLRAIGYSVQPDGLGYVYQIPTMFGSITYGFAGVLLVYRSCRRFFSAASSASAAIFIWLATNLIYYMIAEPSMSHACSFFATSLFLSLWLSYRPYPTLKQWILLGISGGMIALVRLPDATWLALPVMDSVLMMKADWRIRLPRFIKGLLIYSGAAAVIFIPQMILSHILYGNAVLSGYTHAGSRFHWLSPRWMLVLFSLRHGLFSWHPVLFFAIVGLILFYRKQRSLTLSFAFVAATQVYVVSSWLGWWGGDSFGCRMLINLLPIMAMGFAAVVEWTAVRRAYSAICLLAACCLAWNALFMVQYRMGFISMSNRITFYQLTAGKAAMLKDIPSRIKNMLH